VGHRNLELTSLDVVSRDGNGHWVARSMVGGEAVLDGVGRLLAMAPNTVTWQVIGGQSRFTVAHRLEQLHTLANGILAATGSVFVLPFGRNTVTVRRHVHGVEVVRHPSLDALREYMRASDCATVGFDPTNVRLKALLRAG
jgi:hypothetical protein